MQFKYNFSKRSGGDKVPLIDVVVANPLNNTKVAYPAMIDSGAFMSVFHKDIADTLGLDLRKIKEINFGGVGNKKQSLKGKPALVQIMVAQKGQNHTFDEYVLFSSDIAPNGYPLLGRMGFFTHFENITFDINADRFYLTTK